MKKNILIAGAVGIVATGAVASYFSPYLTMYEMKSAMAEKDADAFSSYVDFPSMRESLRAQFMTMMKAKMEASPDMKGNAFAGLGMMMAVGVANQLIDTMVTPAGVMTMMAQGNAKPAPAVAEDIATSNGQAPENTSRKPCSCPCNSGHSDTVRLMRPQRA